MSYLSVTEMADEDRAGAEILVRAFAPELQDRRWRQLVGRPSPAGTLVLRSDEGSIFGMASYWPQPDGAGGHVLVVDNFLTAELGRSGRGRALLAKGLADRAAALGCTGTWQAPDGPLRNALAVAA